MRLASLVNHVVDFCYPSRCVNCQDEVTGLAVLCPGCEHELTALSDAAACHRCAMPLASEGAPCPHCLGRGTYPFERILRLGVFDGPLKNLIHQMKYHHRWALGEFLAERLFDTERAKGLLTETDVLVPVPLHAARHISRGFNQADVIARRLARSGRIPIVSAVRRARQTEMQANLHSIAARAVNVKDAFALRRSASRLKGKHVVIVDDVMTTAATLRSIARLLKHAEPASLCAIVLAIADPKHRGFEAI